MQLILPFPCRTAMSRADFLVSDANREAVAWIDRYPDWPASALVVYGPKSSGKSHLAAVLRAKDAGAPVFEDIDAAAGKAGEEEALFHAFNEEQASGRRFLLTSSVSPAQLRFLLPDLASRLRAQPSVALSSPDDALLAGVLLKLFQERRIDIEPACISYLVRHMERSFSAAALLADRVNEEALRLRRRVTVPFLRGLLRK